MSLDLQIKIIFTEPIKESHIRSIVRNGSNLGCVFFDNTINDCLTVEDISNILYDGYKIAGEGGSISVNNNSSQFRISVYQETKKNAALSVHLTYNYWKRNPPLLDYDFERYIRLLLDMTADMPLKSISIEYSP